MSKELLQVEEALLMQCNFNGGTITELEIINIFSSFKVDNGVMDEKNFLDKFNHYKEQVKGRASRCRSMTPEASNNLKKLIKSGVTWQELECAVKGMYLPEAGQRDTWAERTGNDTPTHILRNNNFERYLNKYFNHERSKGTEATTARDRALDKLKRAAGL